MSDKPSPIITEVLTNESAYLGGNAPIVPSLVFPGTVEAIQRGCTCDPESNMKRIALGMRPLLDRNCRVHAKICQAEPCVHGDHLDVHDRCEHCTNVLHQCEVCEAVYLEDGDQPELHGWQFVLNVDGVVKAWRCGRCK